MLCGCVSISNYPSSWASLESARQDCFSVGGVYHNEGDGGRFGPPHLAHVFFRGVSGRPVNPGGDIWRQKEKDLVYGVDSVEIAVTKEGTLEVTALYEDRPVIKKQLFANKKEYRCNNGKIELVQSVVDSNGPRQESDILVKSIDGALVVKSEVLGLGLFVIPITGFEWHRFKPYQSGKR